MKVHFLENLSALGGCLDNTALSLSQQTPYGFKISSMLCRIATGPPPYSQNVKNKHRGKKPNVKKTWHKESLQVLMSEKD